MVRRIRSAPPDFPDKVLAPVPARHGRTLLVALAGLGLLLWALLTPLPSADSFREPIAAWIAHASGHEVRLGRVELRGHGLGLRLILSDFALLDPPSGQARFSARRLVLDLLGPASLLARAPRIGGVHLAGANLALRRAADGSIGILGLEQLASQDPGTRDHFLAHGDLRLTDTELTWLDRPAAAPLRFAGVALRLDNQGTHHRLELAGRLANANEDGTATLQLRADLQGTATSPAHWQGQTHLVVSGLELARFGRDRLPARLAGTNGTLTLEGWGDWAAGTLAEASARVKLHDLAFPDAVAKVPRLTAWFRWQPQEGGWQARIADLTLAQKGQISHGTGIDLRVTRTATGHRVAGTLARLDLPLIVPLLPAMPMASSGLLADLSQAQTKGRIEDLNFVLSLPDVRDEAPVDWSLRGRFIDIGTTPSGRIPGFAGLSGTLIGNPRQGRLQLAATDLRLDVPGMFHAPLALNALAGALHWMRGADGRLELDMPDLLAGSAAIQTRSRLSLRIPPEGGTPQLDLRTHFRQGDIATVSRYLPARIMDSDLVQWLDRALVKGRIPSGDLLFQGPLAAFPFDRSEGRFEVLFQVADLELNYHPDWPALKQAKGQLRFLNRGLDIELTQASLFDTTLSPIQAAIPDLGLGRFARVLISGQGRGPFADGLRLVRESPLAERLGRLSKAFAARGQMQLDLDLSIPLADEEPNTLRGLATWPAGDARLALVDTEIALDGLAGSLLINTDGLTAEPMTGRLWGEPVALRIAPGEAKSNADKATRIALDGAMPVAELARRFPGGIWAVASGQAPWHLDLSLRHQDLRADAPPLPWQLTSDLKGLSLDLPPPFGKAAATKRALKLSGVLVPGARELALQASLGQVNASLALMRDTDAGLTLARGAVDLNGQPVSLPAAPGLVVTGSFEQLDLSSWLAWSPRTAPANANSSGRDGPSLPLRQADLRIGRLVFRGLASEDLTVQVKRQPGSWQAQIDAAEWAGVLTWPSGPRAEPIGLHLERLDLAALLDGGARPGAAGAKGPSPMASAGRPTDPRGMRPLDLEVNELSWRGQPIGHVQLRSRPLPAGLDFERLSLKGPLATVAGTGRWIVTPEAATHSELTLQGEGPNLGALLQAFGYRSVFDEAPATASLTLNWPGGPADFAPATIAGRLGFAVGAGRLLEVEPGIGRMLGILNLGALQRRLALDFSDLYGKGFGFERIDGTLIIGNGAASIDKLQIAGPSGDIAITGRTDLVGERLDQMVTVTPKVGSSVALASAVAGGPLIGAAVYVADQVAGGVLDRLSRYQYRVTGPWAEPSFTRSAGPWYHLLGGRPPPTVTQDGQTNLPATRDASAGSVNLFLDLP